MAFQAHHVCRFQQECLISAAVRIMAAGTSHTMRVHRALHKIVALHSILMTRAVRIVSESGITEFVLLQFPVFLEVIAHLEADWPVIIFALNRIFKRLPLRVALDASIVCMRGIKPRGIHYIGLRRPGNVFAAGSMTTFAPHVPFGYRFSI